MANTINMQDMRYINLFGRITRVNTRFCFKYNGIIFFAVPKKLVSKSVGINGKNIKKISETLGKRIKVIASPQGIEDAEKFVSDVISPVTFKEFKIKDNQIIITAGSQSKAAMIGRNKKRLIELQKIVKDYFKQDLRIV